MKIISGGFSKGLAVAVIILFLGVGVQPAIATVEPENIDTEFYNVNIELCGLGKEYTVQLTEQQLVELEIIFETLREKLNNTENKEETIQIYNNAIERLDDIGLLGDYSVTEVQELVTGVFLDSRFNRLYDMLSDKVQDDDNTNSFCLISGYTSKTYFIPSSSKITLLFLLSLDYLNYIILGSNVISNLLLFIADLCIFFIVCRMALYSFRPLNLGGGIFLGFLNIFEYYPEYVPSRGWIRTFGLSGRKNFDGSFIGQIFPFLLCLGVIGFKGIKIYNDIYDKHFYLGFANYVNISQTFL